MARINIPDLLAYKGQSRESPHDKVVKAICARQKLSEKAMAERHVAWKRADEDYRGYTPESVEDIRRKSERSKGVLHYTTITVPLTYAMLLTAHTYWTSIFLARSPIFPLMTRHGAAEQTTLAMEALIDYQILIGKILTPLYVWLLDPGRYGFGVIRTYWDTQIKRVGQLFQVSETDPVSGIAIPGRTFVDKQTHEIQGYRGNRAYNVRPYNWFPDPRVPLADFQSGEFCGDKSYRSMNSLKTNQRYFNLAALEDIRKDHNVGNRSEESGSDRIQLPAVGEPISEREFSDKGSVAILEQTVNLIPKDWNLGDETFPEKWIFTLAEDAVIIGAEPFGHFHDEFPYDLLMYEVEGYALDIRGIMEIGKDFNVAQSWLLNSHMFNVRKSLNDQLVIDPSRLIMKDLLEGGPGKLIRARPSAYGTPMRDAIFQLPVTDITRSNLADTQVISELLQRVLGTNDNVMGTLDPGGRKTATEVRTASTFSISRLKTVAEWFSTTGFAPFAQKLVQNTQQFWFAGGQPGPEVFRVIGDDINDFRSIRITPESIAGAYDYAPTDGTLPVDRMAQANLLKEILMGIVNVPGLGTAYNIDGMINWIARQTGIRNLKQFKIQVMPDQQVKDQAAAGNLVPMGGGQP